MAFLHLLVVCACLSVVYGHSYNDVVILSTDLMKNYTRTVRPVKNQTTPVQVGIYMVLRMIKEFDVVEGVVSSQLYIGLSWTDEFITWTPEEYDNISSVFLPYHSVWVPPMVVFNPAEDHNFMGTYKDQMLVKYTHDGVAYLGFAASVKYTCEPYIKCFPFDTHHCDLLFMHLFYGAHEIIPIALSATDDYLLSNGQWHIEISSFTQEMFANGFRYVKMTLALSRRSYFLVANLFIPIIFLLGMNLFVFILPVESGEKASYSITVLLSLAIFMTIVMDQLPPISTDPPILSIVLLFHLAMNVLVCLCTLVSLMYYHKKTTQLIPWYLRGLVTVVTFRRYTSLDPVGNIADTSTSDKVRNGKVDDTADEVAGHTTNTDQNSSLITWPLVSLAVDRLTLGVCVTGMAVEVVVLICIFSS